MPVCIDPSHSVGSRELAPDGISDLMHVTAQGVVAGANMVLVDFHPNPAKALVDAKFDGIVSAGVGNGNLYHTLFDTLAKASKYGFVAAETLNPQKARVLLMLALTQSKDPAQIQRWFQQF
jgi:L-asparaginase/Glu-tRNA(Gln) amidotransferase subunit D